MHISQFLCLLRHTHQLICIVMTIFNTAVMLPDCKVDITNAIFTTRHAVYSAFKSDCNTRMCAGC